MYPRYSLHLSLLSSPLLSFLRQPRTPLNALPPSLCSLFLQKDYDVVLGELCLTGSFKLQERSKLLEDQGAFTAPRSAGWFAL